MTAEKAQAERRQNPNATIIRKGEKRIERGIIRGKRESKQREEKEKRREKGRKRRSMCDSLLPSLRPYSVANNVACGAYACH